MVVVSRVDGRYPHVLMSNIGKPRGIDVNPNTGYVPQNSAPNRAYESTKLKTPFTLTVDVTVFVSCTFDLFNNMCKRCHRTALSPLLKKTKNGHIKGMCK